MVVFKIVGVFAIILGLVTIFSKKFNNTSAIGKGPFALKGSSFKDEGSKTVFRILVGILTVLFGIGFLILG